MSPPSYTTSLSLSLPTFAATNVSVLFSSLPKAVHSCRQVSLSLIAHVVWNKQTIVVGFWLTTIFACLFNCDLVLLCGSRIKSLQCLLLFVHPHDVWNSYTMKAIQTWGCTEQWSVAIITNVLMCVSGRMGGRSNPSVYEAFTWKLKSNVIQGKQDGDELRGMREEGSRHKIPSCETKHK